MTQIDTTRRAPGRPGPARGTARDTWHLRTGSIVLAWLAAVVVISLVHPFVPASRWLLVHLLVLGAASNAILIWTWHFATAVLRLGNELTRRAQAVRLAVFNAGALVVVAGMVSGSWVAVAVGAGAVTVAVVWHAASLLRAMRKALPSRFGATVRYYVAAGLLLPVGVALGVLMARGGLSDAGHARALVAHAVVNLLGWIGLTVLGTLVTLGPTMLRTRMTDGSEHVARRGLPLLLGAIGVATVGAGAGVLLLTAAGVALYLAALVYVTWPHAEELRRKPPTTFATWSVVAGMWWFAGTLVVLAVGIATAGAWEQAHAAASWLTAPFLAGFAAQVLLGALSYLIPVVLGGGPNAVRATNRVFDTGGPARVVAANAALLLCVLPVPSLVRVIGSVVVLVALASFLPLAVRAVRVSRRPPSEPVPDGTSSSRRMGLAAAGLAVVVLAAAGGVAADPTALGLSTRPSSAGDVRPTGQTTEVELHVKGMRFTPGAIEVPAGNRLVITLVNTGTDTHDLVLETGARTPRLRPGQRARLDVGVVGRDLEGWCSVAGHRQMGMVLKIRRVGAAVGVTSGNGSTQAQAPAPSAAESLDLMADPGPGFRPRDATLSPARDGTVHRVTLKVQEVQREVAPGVMQTLWTYDGTAPGPTLRGKVGDRFEVTLVNDGSIGHSVDFHAGALAPDGPMRTIQPAESLTYSFTATRSGIWMYHCSTMPMSLHIANGMFGAVVIDPP
ncbi:MAG TPA: multicopper oxidase domain-containing protein, partial [Actinomycetales bacterium]|nr:multicopper oxidase domain-containing protein [Actinomycetales bacterium]